MKLPRFAFIAFSLLSTSLLAVEHELRAPEKHKLPVTTAPRTQDTTTESEPSRPTDLKFGIAFPPVHDPYARDFTLRHLTTLGTRRIRIDESWRKREAVKGTRDWRSLDEIVLWAQTNEIAILLTIQAHGPDWACHREKTNKRSCVYSDSQAFSQYISALLKRYSNKVDQIQFGNEWTYGSWYAGSAEDFVRFNNIVFDLVQTYSPGTRVVLAGVASATMRTLAFCAGKIRSHFLYNGQKIVEKQKSICESANTKREISRTEHTLKNAHFDAIDLHFYDDAEQWPIYYNVITDLLPTRYPVIASEFGGPNLIWEKPYSDDLQVERLKVYFKTLRMLGVSEAYFFKLIQSNSATPQHRESGLMKTVDGQLINKPAYAAFIELVQRTTTNLDENEQP